MPKLSAGLILFRNQGQTEVLLVHPGGPFWATKDLGSWSIPKGEYEQGADPFAAAKREFKEETGLEVPAGKPVPLGEVSYGNKRLSAWAITGEADITKIKSNYFELEWPPKTGKTQQFPEVDQAGWFTLAQAKNKLVVGQTPLIDRLAEFLGQRNGGH